MASDFEITTVPTPANATILRVAGRLDARNAQALFAHSKEVLGGGKKQLVINLAEVSFVASSGIGTLLALTEEFQDVGGCAHYVALSEAVRSVVELLNLTQFLTIDGSEEEALETIGA